VDVAALIIVKHHAAEVHAQLVGQGAEVVLLRISNIH
jgi:hypothetical protein